MRLAVPAEGMTLLFHRPSGATHVLLPPSPEILDALADGPADAVTIAERLIARYGVDVEDASIEAVIAARLAELAAAGLVFAA